MGYHSLLLSSHLRRPILATGILLRMPKQLARHGIVRAARGEMATLYLLTSREEVRRQPQPPRRRASRRHPSTMKDRVSCRRHHRHHRLRCRVSCRRVSHLLTHTGTVRLRNCTCVLAGFDDNVLGSMAHGRARRACPRTRKLEPHCCAWRWPRYRPDDTLHLGGVAVARQHVPVRERSPAGARAVARKQHRRVN